MRIFLYFLIVLLFVACANTKPQAYPQWYKHRELQSAVKYEIIGYGQGKTFKEAQGNAKEDIAYVLISKVDSSFTSTTSTDNDTFSKKSQSRLKITSKLNLHNVKTMKQEQINNIFYVALKYENLDLAYRIISTVGKVECSQNIPNSYLLQTPLIKKLTASIGCELDFKLDRRNEAWYLKYKEHLFLLSDDEFEELYVSTKNDTISMKPNKKVLYDGDSFYFTFNSKKKGYITFIDVYENGIVTLLQESAPIKNILQIPSKKSENYFEAGLVKEGQNTYDLYIAVYSEKPLDMSRFMYVSEELAKSEVAYKFDELIQFLKGYDYSSILLRTKVN